MIKPISLASANAYVIANHRHHKRVRGHKFSLGLFVDDVLRGVVIVGRPVARCLDDGLTLELLRVCTDGIKNGCSILISQAKKAARALHYKKLLTYILAEESGVSCIAAGMSKVADVRGRSWDCASRPRSDKHPTTNKSRYEINL